MIFYLLFVDLCFSLVPAPPPDVNYLVSFVEYPFRILPSLTFKVVDYFIPPFFPPKINSFSGYLNWNATQGQPGNLWTANITVPFQYLYSENTAISFIDTHPTFMHSPRTTISTFTGPNITSMSYYEFNPVMSDPNDEEDCWYRPYKMNAGPLIDTHWGKCNYWTNNTKNPPSPLFTWMKLDCNLCKSIPEMLTCKPDSFYDQKFNWQLQFDDNGKMRQMCLFRKNLYTYTLLQCSMIVQEGEVGPFAKPGACTRLPVKR